jgi:cyclopropane fatty-acyl-phospholipid synthase-like methyltransferase
MKKKDWFLSFHKSRWTKPDETGAEEAALIQKILKLRKGQSVLDAPCGRGRIAVHLAKAGINVTGIDITPYNLNFAKKRFINEKLKGEFRLMDLRDMEFDEEFDAAFNWFGSFGYFSDEENLDVARRYARALKPGGRLILEQVNRERILRKFMRVKRDGDMTVTNRWDKKTQRTEAEWTVTEGTQKIRWTSSIRMYTVSEFRELYRRLGMNMIAVYGSWDGKPYTRSGARMVTVGQKSRT